MKKRSFAVTTRVLVSSLVLMGMANTGYAGWGNDLGWRSRSNNSAVASQKTGSQNTVTTVPLAADVVSQDSVSISVASAVPKLFWATCGPPGVTFLPGGGNNQLSGVTFLPGGGNNQLCNGYLSYVDPFVASPVPTPFVGGATFVTNGRKDGIGFWSATVNLTTYQMTGLKEAFVYYFKLGRIYQVDTTTLVATQVSSEVGATANTLCQIQPLENITAPLNSTIAYRLKGPDGICNTADDLTRAVKLSMGPLVAPITLARWPIQQLFDGTYITVKGWPTTIVERCQANLITCTPITTTNQNVWDNDHDATRIIFHLGGGIASYNYVANTFTPLYTQLAGESIISSRLDRDGFVYFSVTRYIAPFTNSVRRVPVTGGVATTLASFDTTYPLMYLGLDLTPTHVGYEYPDASNSFEIVRAIPKAGGIPVVISNYSANGGFAGSVALVEDIVGTVRAVDVATGAILAARANTQLNGVSLGGSADWHYGFNPATSRLFLSSIDNQLKSYAFGENFALPAAGLLIGTVPVNLNNFRAVQPGNDLIGDAERRGGNGGSPGNDMLFMRAATVLSLKRLTNSSYPKIYGSIR